ncbi:MAG: chloramphenicol acetyltransferase [Leptolyngbyaceae cyanobacterium MO_188.B28]|nr:chloramphenicol acetyltransferase [Leptolyngbyaceae cyanobacterium MO_188.B28]
MASHLDIKEWERREHYYFFRDFENPFFTICADVDITQTLNYVKQHQLSFFLASLYLSIAVANRVKEFRYRIQDDDILIHERVHPSSTVLNDNKTFSFCYFKYTKSFSEFNESSERILRLNREVKQQLASGSHRSDVIYYSVIPWISFKSFTNLKRNSKKDSIPKIVFGKYYKDGQSMKMPVSVEVNHALIDGFHMGEFFKYFQEILSEPEQILGL